MGRKDMSEATEPPMSKDKIEVFVICRTDEIWPGEAKAFSLSRRTAAGEVRPFPIVITRVGARNFYGYVNVCPHERSWLNFNAGTFLTADGKALQCGRHGAQFDIASGLCVAGKCAGQSLTPLALAVIAGDVCLCGEPLVADERTEVANEYDDTMEIMIHPG